MPDYSDPIYSLDYFWFRTKACLWLLGMLSGNTFLFCKRAKQGIQGRIEELGLRADPRAKLVGQAGVWLPPKSLKSCPGCPPSLPFPQSLASKYWLWCKSCICSLTLVKSCRQKQNDLWKEFKSKFIQVHNVILFHTLRQRKSGHSEGKLIMAHGRQNWTPYSLCQLNSLLVTRTVSFIPNTSSSEV